MQHPAVVPASNQPPPVNNVVNFSPTKVAANPGEVCSNNGVKSPGSVSSEGQNGEKSINDDHRYAIIDAVYLRPDIWNSCGRQAKSLCERKNHFADIAKQLHSTANANCMLTASDIEKQWKNLKDTYNKVKKKISVDENGCMIPPRWRFFNAMLFLDHVEQQYQQPQSEQNQQSQQVIQQTSSDVAHTSNTIAQSPQSIVVMPQDHHQQHQMNASRKRPYTLEAERQGSHKLSPMESPREHIPQLQVISIEGRTLTNLSPVPPTSIPAPSYIHPAQIPVTLSQQPQLVDPHHGHIPIQMVSSGGEIAPNSMPSVSHTHTLIPTTISDALSQLETPSSNSNHVTTTSAPSGPSASEDEYDAFCRSLAFPLREIGVKNRIEFLRLQKSIQDLIYEKQMATLIPSSQHQKQQSS
ncbi:hypothetical protein L596_006827 [Steinernema carpocapsae]|uniref:MADF domain-containing protein n=1 Tax=Steinernema carpocapsae TaxID=34508 RepID=A0A4U5P7Z6_STECR|nr:hypothetical protein L596_006827 [Steinernema carpocapsae]